LIFEPLDCAGDNFFLKLTLKFSHKNKRCEVLAMPRSLIIIETLFFQDTSKFIKNRHTVCAFKFFSLLHRTCEPEAFGATQREVSCFAN